MVQDTHVFKGMQQDVHPIRQDGSFMWEAHNIRITNREGNTYLSMTNEKGTKQLTLSQNIEGAYMGHCVVGKYLVLFTTAAKVVYTKETKTWIENDPSEDSEGIEKTEVKETKYPKTDSIYRIYESDSSDCDYTVELLYNKDLNFDIEHPLQTLGVFEGELVQKVYWVDGINQPRFINVTLKELKESEDEDLTKLYEKVSFDFTPVINAYGTFNIERIPGMGEFAPGVIQYAFTYYNKYGQESNIFHVTPLYYISYDEGGASPEDKVPVSFKITIKNASSHFQYVRVYSIHRTSINATPTVKQVIDLEITLKYEDYTNSLTYVDTGTEGSVVDPTMLLYLGGETISANAIASKDNTLFLGNIKVNSSKFFDVTKYVTSDDIQITTDTRDIDYKSDAALFYPYDNQLKYSDIAFYMPGDFYRVGMQFLCKDGSWTDPCYLTDIQIPITNRPKLNYENSKVTVPTIKITVNKTIREEILNTGNYEDYRFVVAYPENKDRVVLAQGVLNPTVFSASARLKSLPFAQASWFFRPMHTSTSNLDNDEGIKQEGSVISSGHWDNLLGYTDKKISYEESKTVWTIKDGKWTSGEVMETSSKEITVPNRGAEIQTMQTKTFVEVNTTIQDHPTGSAVISKDEIGDEDINTFFVDQSIVTFNSPEIEFDDSIRDILDGYNATLDIVGLIPINHTAGDIDIQTSSAAPGPKDVGFFHRTVSSKSDRSLVAGLFYGSHAIDDFNNGTDFSTVSPKDSRYQSLFMVYPWQRSGSLNNDITRPENNGTRTAVLKRKVISNIKVSNDNIFFDKVTTLKNITSTSIFDSDNVSLIKIPIPKNSNIGKMNYYGNVDTMIISKEYVPICVSVYPELTSTDSPTLDFGSPIVPVEWKYNTNKLGDYSDSVKGTKDPVRMKYKSTPHAVFSFNYAKVDEPVPQLLPYVTTSTINITTSENLKSFTDSKSNKALNVWFNPISNKAPYWNVGTSSQSGGDTGSKDITVQYDSWKEYSKGESYLSIKEHCKDYVRESLTSIKDKEKILFNCDVGAYQDGYYVVGYFDENNHYIFVGGEKADLEGYSWINYKSEYGYYKKDEYRTPYEINISKNSSVITVEKIILTKENIGDRYKYRTQETTSDGKYVYKVYTVVELDLKYTGGTPPTEGKYESSSFYSNYTLKYKGYEDEDGNEVQKKDDVWQTVEKDVDDTSNNISDYQEEIIYDGLQDNIGYLFLGELRREVTEDFRDALFGGTSNDAILNTKWIPVGSSSYADGSTSTYEYTLKGGDTYYQRYDCLKTYPFTNEDENSIVEILSFMCTTKINIDGRYDKNRGQRSNLNMSPTNFNLLNNVYSQKNNFFTYRKLEDDMYKVKHYPSQVIWSREKSNLGDIDTWTAINTSSSYDLDGNKGKLTSIANFNELLVAFQDKAVSQLLYNSRVQIPTSEGVPIEISNSSKMEGVRFYSDTIGCQNRDALVKSPSGIYFVDYNNSSLWKFDGNLTNLSDTCNNKWWFYDKKDVGDWFINNPNNVLKMHYDPKKKDLYINKSVREGNDTLCYSEELGGFMSMMSYNGSVMIPFNDRLLSITSDTNVTKSATAESITDDDGNFLYDLETTQDITTRTSTLWENQAGDYNYFYGDLHLPDFTYISNDNPSYDKIFDTIEFQADFFSKEGIQHVKSFDWIRTYNEYQDTKNKNFTQVRASLNSNGDMSLRKKFRVWRGQIPRVGRQRIRNPWTAIQLGFNTSDIEENNKFKFVFHNIKTGYTT